MTTSTLKRIDEACVLTREGEYLQALTMFFDIYGTDQAPPLTSPKAANGLSFFGLSLALVEKKFKEAIELCKRAVDLEFYNGDHYANFSRVYTAAGNRKKAIEIAHAGLKILPDHEELVKVRKELGIRAKPTVPFLDRGHPINVTLGQSRHAKKVAETEKKPASGGKRAPARPAARRDGKKR
jgi:tetratricopeptide (TPR) repeat protein